MAKLHRPSLEAVITVVVIAAAVIFVLAQLSPSLIFLNTTPAGGDTGAHVWGPDFLKNHLLPHGRISGWAPDWYAGFPAYTFYFPLPAVMIAFLSYVVPYGVAFKVVTVLGLLTLPVAAYAFGRLSGMRFPGPTLLAVATVPYLFYYGFYEKSTGAWSNTIYGGNIASALAGEFAFSISLSFALVFLGVVSRGLRTGRHRALAAILLALTGLSHLLPTIFAVLGAGVILLVNSGKRRAVYTATVLGLGACLAAFWTVPFLFRFRSYSNNMGWEKVTHYMDNLFPSGILWVTLLAAVGVVGSIAFRRRTGLALVGMLVLAGFIFVAAPEGRLWNARALPFWYLCLYLLAGVGVLEIGSLVARFASGKAEQPARAVLLATPVLAAIAAWIVVGLPLHVLPGWVRDPDWRWLVLVILAAAIAASSFRRAAAGALAVVAVIAGVFGELLSVGAPWGGRMRSLFHLSLYMLAAIVVLEGLAYLVLRTKAVREGRAAWTEVAVPLAAALVAWFAVAGPLDVLHNPLPKWKTTDTNFLPSWARWNYSGYERKTAYPEYRGIIDTMAQVGRDHGCGRVHWEYESGLDRFGTPLALMLLPYWTHGCIGSMEGLYFESSATVPYHFLSAGELSKAPSNPMRNLPYRSLNVAEGVKDLQLLGARYYIAFSPEALSQARSDPDLTEIASTGAWRVFQVRGSDLVTPLQFLPAVMTGPHSGVDWMNASVDWYMNTADRDVLLAGSGPSSWPRVKVRKVNTSSKTHGAGVSIASAAHRPVDSPARVSNVKTTDDRISFNVDNPGAPVLVKASYFPNWQVSGAKGPYRVTPNLMVVVPTSKHVSMHYGYTPVDALGWVLTIAGVVLTVLVARHRMIVDDDGTDADRRPERGGKAVDGEAGATPDEEFELIPGRHTEPVPIPNRRGRT